MSIWKQLFISAPLIGALVTSPAVAQDDEWESDDPLAFGLAMDLDLDFEGLEEKLRDLGGGLSFDFRPGFVWTDDYCEDDDDCDVRVIVDKGKRFVIVNGDTVETTEDEHPHRRHFAYKFGPGMHLRGYGPEGDFHRKLGEHFGFRQDPALRELEREARSIARKARNASDTDRASLESELDRKLNEIFDYKLRRRQQAIEKAEERVSKLRERQSERESARDQIIENRKDELLGRDRYLEW